MIFKNYVMGLIYDDIGRVLLIKKNRPKHQVGKWNGVGGKIEEGENSLQAMTREIKEETGLDIPTKDCNLIFSSSVYDGSLFIFEIHIKAKQMDMAKTITDEMVGIFSTDTLPKNCMEDVETLIKSKTKKGPVRILLISGAHNNEEYVKYLLKDLSKTFSNSPYTIDSFELNLKESPIKRDLSFNLNRIEDHQLIFKFNQKIKKLYNSINNYDIIIDLHNSPNIENLNLISFSEKSEKHFHTWKSLQNLKTPFLFRKAIFNTISGYARDLNKVSVTCEIGGMSPFMVAPSKKAKDLKFIQDTIDDCIDIYQSQFDPKRTLSVFDETKILYEIDLKENFSENPSKILKLNKEDFIAKDFPFKAYETNTFKFRVYGIGDFYSKSGILVTCENKVTDKSKISFLIKK